MRYLAITIPLLILGCVADAQPADDPFTRLLSARSIRCELDKGTQASWDGGNLKLEDASMGKGGQVTFDSIDSKAGTARVIGNVGATDALLIVTASGLTLALWSDGYAPIRERLDFEHRI